MPSASPISTRYGSAASGQPRFAVPQVVRRRRVGGREVDLRFDRAEDATLVAVTRNPADLEVAVHY